MRLLAGIVLGICTSVVVSPAMAAERIPVRQQNAIVQKHCAVCHNDGTLNGGLSLQDFDAASVAPSLAAMMLSKLTSGLPLDTVSKASSDDAPCFKLIPGTEDEASISRKRANPGKLNRNPAPPSVTFIAVAGPEDVASPVAGTAW